MSTGAEKLVDDVTAYMTAQLTGRLTALDAEYTDTIVLDPMAAYQIARKKLDAIQNYPTMFIVVEDTDFQPLTHSDAMTNRDEHTLVCGVVALDQDADTLQRKCYRYARAIKELLVEGARAGTIAFHLRSAVAEFSPVFADTDSRAIQDAHVRARMVAR